MAEITAAAVKALRDRTDLPMMECKRALVEAEGDEEKAIEILTKNATKILDKRSANNTAEGRIFTLFSDDNSEVAMIEIQCESAPVGGGEDMTTFGNAAIKQLMEGPGAATPEELLAQDSPDGSGETLQQQFDGMINKIREKIVVNRIIRVAGPAGAYVHHDGKTGVLFQATGEGDTELLRDMAMHIAALKPTVVSEEELAADVVKTERDRLTEEALATGKPENIVGKIVDGRMSNFYVENGVLLHQAFAKDDTKTVSKALSEKGFEAVAFHRWVIGN